MNPTLRVPLTIALVLLATAIFILTYSYRKQFEHYQNAELTRLNAIAKTIANEINGDLHRQMTIDFTHRDQISSNGQHPTYRQIHELLKRAHTANGVETDIYTLFLESDSVFYFGVSSGALPYYRHTWHTGRPEHRQYYRTGSFVGPYTDEHGVWLSAFAPIHSSSGDVVAIIQVDQQFNAFIDRIRQELISELLVVLAVFIIVVVLLFNNVTKHLRREDLFKKRLEFQTNLIHKKNQDITDSLRSAEHIQKTLMPDMNEVTRHLESAVLFLPRDIVGGDFFWFKNTGSYLYAAVADCTGHGVPGGFMSMIGQTALNDILENSPDRDPAFILQQLNQKVRKLVQDKSNEGMDISLCRFDPIKRELMFSGANRPIYYTNHSQNTLILGNREGINGYSHLQTEFSNQTITMQEGDCVYLFSDGFQDQFGGKDGKKLMRKQLCAFFDSICKQQMPAQQHHLTTFFDQWRGGFDQVDDVLVWAVRLK